MSYRPNPGKHAQRAGLAVLFSSSLFSVALRFCVVRALLGLLSLRQSLLSTAQYRSEGALQLANGILFFTKDKGMATIAWCISQEQLCVEGGALLTSSSLDCGLSASADCAGPAGSAKPRSSSSDNGCRYQTLCGLTDTR